MWKEGEGGEDDTMLGLYRILFTFEYGSRGEETCYRA